MLDDNPEGSWTPMDSKHYTSTRDARGSPYRLVQDKVEFRPNEQVTVTLYTVGKEFKGFVVKATDQQGHTVGRFMESCENETRYRPLGNHPGAATNKDSGPKKEVVLLWSAPDIPGTVSFIATVVCTCSEFYTNLQSTVRQ
ncbi:uncharacterized protein LOC144151404 [Haemaphysalis longicornis]